MQEVVLMKRFMAVVCAITLFASLASFAGDHGKKMSVDEKISWMAKELSLTADQQTKLKPILENQQKQMEAVWQDASLSEDAKMAKKKEIKSATGAQIKALLSSDQQEKFAALNQPKSQTAAK